VATPAPRAIVSTVRAFARRHDIFRPGPLIVAVSGGTDSVALALILAELRDEFGLVLHVAHFDHRTRTRTSARDAAFVAEIADRIGAPIRAGRAERAAKSEDDARTARYAFLRRAAAQVGATAIATGHTRDDQAETVLLHLTRGSGLDGVAAMRPLRDGIARPLLEIGRADTEAICRAAKIRPREDPTNRSLTFARNRVRLRVLPELRRINPRTAEALARFAEAAWAFADASPAAPEPSADPSAGVPQAIERASRDFEVAALPETAIARDRLLADAWRSATGVTLSARHRAALTALAGSTAGTRRIDLPGGQAMREYGHLELVPGAATHAAADGAPSAPAPVKRGRSVEWHGWRITLDMPSDGLPHSATITETDAAQIVVRARRPGDRIKGRGKLQDVFVNAKIPVRQRDAWPLVTLNGEEILWVPGVTPAPRSGSVSIAAGPTPTPTQGTSVLRKSSENGQVASKSVHRPRGGNRERA